MVRLYVSLLILNSERDIKPFIINGVQINAIIVTLVEICFLAHRIRFSEILPWDRKSILTHAILPRTSSNVIMRNCILAYLGTS